MQQFATLGQLVTKHTFKCNLKWLESYISFAGFQSIMIRLSVVQTSLFCNRIAPSGIDPFSVVRCKYFAPDVVLQSCFSLPPDWLPVEWVMMPGSRNKWVQSISSYATVKDRAKNTQCSPCTASVIFLSSMGDTCSIRMPALRPASLAGLMRSPRDGSSVVLCDPNTIRLAQWCV